MGIEVRRMSRSYVRPAAATPAGSLELSAIDRVVGLRHMVPSLHVYPPRGGAGEGQLQQQSPATVVREALGKALVDYYPLAGRLVDGPDDGPASARVECTGEGAWFVEAVAGCSLEDVARLENYPFAIPEGDLLPDEAPGVEPLDLPLMMQVTEFTCGGFVVGLTSSHAMTDGLGAGQFINAIADYARGLPRPRVIPIWSRGELVPNPPKLLSGPLPVPRMLKLRYHTVDLSIDGIEHAKSQFLQSTGQRCSTFDVAIARLWQARTRSLRLADPSTRVSLGFFANTRHLMRGGASATAGFYGNCFYTVTVSAESGAVVGADLAGVVAMIRDAKARLPAEFARWAAGERVEPDPYDLSFSYESLFVTDWTRLGFTDADYGWGTPSQVIPFAFQPFMPKAIIGAPPAPKAGARITTQCVEEVNLTEFKDEMEAF
ncbi:hypothetical protein C2845_PM07G07350 [Panicum miliaceum]|uniref:10-deacetylbaccatin III 10-O-acetyltransferase-like n=1 Tax=Panicum miliaceum TaxID=4540 RepID=A0A3L6SJP7_PANMI|nr:hypothetical protein C2845_PM07G07350 [Panicum miliaceum]